MTPRIEQVIDRVLGDWLREHPEAEAINNQNAMMQMYELLRAVAAEFSDYPWPGWQDGVQPSPPSMPAPRKEPKP